MSIWNVFEVGCGLKKRYVGLTFPYPNRVFEVKPHGSGHIVHVKCCL
jgi:hypothetical protein